MLVHEDLTQDYQALVDRHFKEIVQLLEEFGDSQLKTSLRLQAYENERKQEEGQGAATIVLPEATGRRSLGGHEDIEPTLGCALRFHKHHDGRYGLSAM